MSININATFVILSVSEGYVSKVEATDTKKERSIVKRKVRVAVSGKGVTKEFWAEQSVWDTADIAALGVLTEKQSVSGYFTQSKKDANVYYANIGVNTAVTASELRELGLLS